MKRSKYSLSVDCVVFGFIGGKLHVALIERKNAPFKGDWAIPGGFVEGDETVEEAAYRELLEETGIHDLYLQQCRVFSKPDRDPRGRVVTVAFFALIASDKAELVATKDAVRAQWWSINNLPPLAFDHAEIYTTALAALKEAVTLKPLLFALLPKEFTLTMLQNLHEQIFGKQMDKRNFRKKMVKMEWLQATSNITQNKTHRPAQLYCFNKD